MEEISIEERIQALPQELQDITFEFYLEIPSEITIDESYKPAPQLQINQKSRASNLSQLENSTVDFTNKTYLRRWLQVLGPSDECGNPAYRSGAWLRLVKAEDLVANKFERALLGSMDRFGTGVTIKTLTGRSPMCIILQH